MTITIYQTGHDIAVKGFAALVKDVWPADSVRRRLKAILRVCAI